MSAPEPVGKDPMPYRRDLLDIRVVVRQAGRDDARTDARMPGAPRAPESVSEPVAPESAAPGAAPGAVPPEVILVKVGFKHVATRVQEILYVESARNYVRLYLENGAVLKSRVPIERFARHLGADRFLRIHRGRLVNRSRIRAVTPLAGGRLQLTLSQGSTIVVARDRRRTVLKEIGAVLERGVRPPVPTPAPFRPIR